MNLQSNISIKAPYSIIVQLGWVNFKNKKKIKNKLFFLNLLISEHGEDVDLRPRFKRRDHSRSNATNNKYIPPRHKIAANSEGSQMAGHLRSRKTSTGGRSTGGKWKRSWFVLKDRVLYHYRASEDTVAIETLPVLGWNLQPAHSADKVHIIILI